MTMAARMPRITTTIRISTRVNPRSFDLPVPMRGAPCCEESAALNKNAPRFLSPYFVQFGAQLAKKSLKLGVMGQTEMWRVRCGGGRPGIMGRFYVALTMLSAGGPPCGLLA